MKRQPLKIDTDKVFGLSMLAAEDDELRRSHLRLLVHHPGFRRALSALAEDLEETVGGELAAALSTFDPDDAPYPLVAFAEEWGLAPATAATLASVGIENAERGDVLSTDRHSILIRETPSAITIRIPRPLTPGRTKAVGRYLKSKRAERGPVEQAWGIAGKKRQDVSGSIEEALPWFERWNAGEEPAAIWRDVKETDKAGVVRDISLDAFVTQLRRLWVRLIELSPEGIRPDAPSKRMS